MASRFTIENDDGTSLTVSRASDDRVSLSVTDGPFEIDVILNSLDATAFSTFLQTCSMRTFDAFDPADDEDMI